MAGAPAWKRLELVLEGGYAGLRRGASLRPGELPAARPLVAQLLLMRSPGAPGHPDGETLTIVIETRADPCQLCFDSAELPEPAAELLDLLRDRLKPLPYPP